MIPIIKEGKEREKTNKANDIYYIINQCKGMANEVIQHREKIEKMQANILHNSIEIEKISEKLTKLMELSGINEIEEVKKNDRNNNRR